MRLSSIYRFIWPGTAILSLAFSAYLWRCNALLEAQVAQWRAERVTAQVAAYQIKLKPADASAAPQAIQPPPNQTPTAANLPTTEEKAVVEALKNEVVVSFGSVEQMGSRFAAFFASQQARNLRSQAQRLGGSEQSLSPEEIAQGQRDLAEVLGMLPEVEKFQNQPKEYGRFFRGLFESGGALTEAEAAKVEELMKQRATEGISKGVNAGNKPEEGLLMWEMKRDAFNEQTADQLKAILPQKAQEVLPVDGPLMEFLEMDFDAAGMTLPETKKS